MRHRHHRDGARALLVERAKITEKIGRGLVEIARGTNHRHGYCIDPRHDVGPKARALAASI